MSYFQKAFLPILFSGLLLCGCSMETLEEIPRDYVLITQKPQESVITLEITQESDAEEENTSFLMEVVSEYAYNTLSDAEKIWYWDIKGILDAFQTQKELSRECLEAGLNETNIDKIFQAVLNDHPELFFVDGYSYTKYLNGETIESIQFSGSYTMDYDTAAERREQIEEAAAAILTDFAETAVASAADSEYEKVKYVYETVILQTEYDLDAPDNQNIYSVLVNHRSVCQGYAKTTQYLLNRLGVECTLVTGEVENGEGHVWNLVKVDGRYYYVDTTWGDASYTSSMDASAEADRPVISYDYLCVTTEEILRTHSLKNLFPLPECIATQANYYAREGALFTEYREDQMHTLFQKAREQGKKDVTLKCADRECYENVKSILIDQYKIFDYLPDNPSSIEYARNDPQLSLTFWVTNE